MRTGNSKLALLKVDILLDQMGDTGKKPIKQERELTVPFFSKTPTGYT